MFRCLNNRVLIKPDELSNETPSGIITAERPAEKPVVGTVVVGNKDVKEGDRVLFSKFGYDEVEIENETYYVVSDFNVLGVL